MSSGTKPEEMTWVWPVNPVTIRPSPPNRLIDASTVEPGNEVRMPGTSQHDRAIKYIILGVEEECDRNGGFYYRPTAAELEVVKRLLEGEPGNPAWGVLVSMLMSTTPLSINTIRKMRCSEIVEVLAPADPDRLRAELVKRQHIARAWSARFKKVAADLSQTGQSLSASASAAPLIAQLRNEAQQFQPTSKPQGWSRSELIDHASKVASLSGTTFDQIRKHAGIASGPHRAKGPRRRYSCDDLQKLTNTARSGRFLNGKHIANAWQLLLEL